MDKKEEIKEILKRAHATELERFLSSLEYRLKRVSKYGFINSDGIVSFKVARFPKSWEWNNKFFSDRTVRSKGDDYTLCEWRDEFVGALNELVSARLLKSHVVQELHEPVIIRDGYRGNQITNKIVGYDLRFRLKVR